MVVPSKRKEAEECYLSYVAGLMDEVEQAALRARLKDDPAFAQAWHSIVAEAEDIQLEKVLSSLDIEEKLHASKEKNIRKIDRRFVRSAAWLVSIAAVLLVVMQFYRPFFWRPSSSEDMLIASQQTDSVITEVTFQAEEGKKWVLDGHQQDEKESDMLPMKLSSFLEEYALAKSPTKYYTLSTPVVKDYKMQLEDGTLIWLNRSTTVRFPSSFQGNAERRVYLDGEAYFDVAHRADQPFIVVTKQGEVEVKGTRFNLSTDTREGMTTALVTGRVVVKNKQDASVTLEPGEEAIINLKGELRTGNFHPDDRLSWMRGVYFFYKISFSELSVLLSKWYGVRVQFDANFPMDESISGVLYKNKLPSLLENIKRTTGHTYQFRDSTVFFLK